MFKQLVVICVLLVGLVLADPGVESGPSGSPLSALHSSLFYVSADPQEVHETLQQLSSAKQLIQSQGDQEGLFADRAHYDPELLLGVYSEELTCNPERAHQIGQLIDYHRGKHGVSNVLELLNFARRYQLADCRLQEIQSRLGKTIGELDFNTKLELPSVERFVAQLDSDKRDRIMSYDELPADEVADLVLAYLKQSGKAPWIVARVLNDKHVKSVVGSTVDLLESINRAYQSGLGLFSELSKDSFGWRKLGAGEQSKILVGRFCQLVANSENVRELVDAKL